LPKLPSVHATVRIALAKYRVHNQKVGATMPETLPPHAQRWAKLLQDAIATDSAIREGLHDDDALPFIEWGRAQAERVAARWAAQGLSPDEEQLDEAAGALIDLMTDINWAVRYRRKKGTAWLVNRLRSINALSRELFGEGAPTLNEETMAAWVTDNIQNVDGQVLRGLLAQLTPPEKPPVAPPLPGRPPLGTASAQEHAASTEQASGGILGDALGRLANASDEKPPDGVLGDTLDAMANASEETPPAQTLGDVVGGTFGDHLRRALHDLADAAENATDAPSDPDTATSPGEDHDQTQ